MIIGITNHSIRNRVPQYNTIQYNTIQRAPSFGDNLDDELEIPETDKFDGSDEMNDYYARKRYEQRRKIGFTMNDTEIPATKKPAIKRWNSPINALLNFFRGK